MKKSLLLVIMLFTLCLSISSACAQTEGDFAYTISGGKATITAYTGSAGELTLPDTLGGYPVTAIRYCAFRNCTSLTRVVIPEGVVCIGSNAFQNCSSLQEILVPESVTRIDTHAFYGCSSLRQIHLHDNLDRINILAFYGCSAARICNPYSLTAYVLTDIGYSFSRPDYPQLTLKAFEDGNGLRTFTVDACDETAVSVSFPDGITAIESYAFFNCAGLTEIVLPEGVTRIDDSAFEDCSSLRRITIPDSVETIADNAFSGCFDVTIIASPGSAGHAFAAANAGNGLIWHTP